MTESSKKAFLWVAKVTTWLGIMMVLGLGLVLVWALVSHGSTDVTTLKWGQFVQTLGVFLLPPLLYAVIWDQRSNPFNLLRLNRGANWSVFLLAVAIMLCAFPAINLLVDLNGRIVLPECLQGIEQWMRKMEDAAEQLMADFLKVDSIWGLLINVGLIALLPAISEELTFRGVLQQLCHGDAWQEGRAKWKIHMGIWIAAFIFSAIHLQFYGFIPRMLMGAMFGYAFVWTGSLWVPIVMHFTNNFMVVVVNYALDQYAPEDTNYADTFGAGTTWWLGVLSLIVVCVLLGLLYRSTHKE